MVNGIETAASGMMSILNYNDIIANNLANVNTPGFKALIPTFKNISDIEIKEKTKDEQGDTNKPVGTLSAGSVLDSTLIDLKQGALSKTDNKLDFAIEGDGFFAIQTPEGECYTRNGSFTLNNEGVLVTKDGKAVLSESNSEIKIGLDNTNTGISVDKLTVGEDGTLYLKNQAVDKFKIVNFNTPSDLETIGNSLFKKINTDIQPIAAQNSKVSQGYIEGSNSSVIENLINSISASRSYESLSKVIKTSEMTLSKAVNEVGRVRDF